MKLVKILLNNEKHHFRKYFQELNCSSGDVSNGRIIVDLADLIGSHRFSVQDTWNDSMRNMTIFGRIGLDFSGRAFFMQDFHKPDEKELFHNKLVVKISDPSLK